MFSIGILSHQHDYDGLIADKALCSAKCLERIVVSKYATCFLCSKCKNLNKLWIMKILVILSHCLV